MKKIMFNESYGLHESVMKGEKTQTRRVVPKSAIEKADYYTVEYFNETFDVLTLEQAVKQLYFVEKSLKLPYNIGDIVAIAQRYSDIINANVGFKGVLMDKDNRPRKEFIKGWNNKMFVQAGFMPHHVLIMNVRIERLKAITDEDCLKEGIYEDGGDDSFIPHYFYNYHNSDSEGFKTPQLAYSALIDRISGKGTWECNPLVFVYDFKVID